ncbi:MAG: IS30 family transposase [Paraglaciecola psychrophila]|jgi:IS30 family transposase
MKKTYQQLTLAQRYQIQARLEAGFSLTETAEMIGRNKSTISRELNRCLPGRYDAEKAHKDAYRKRKVASKASSYTPALWGKICNCLENGLSPVAIAGRLELEFKELRISHETIYQWIYRDKREGGKTHKRLLRAYRGTRKRHRAHDGRGLLADRVSIHERPIAADQRLHYGHWEGDTIHGRDGNFVTLTDRKSRLLDARKTQARTKAEVGQRLISMLASHGAKTLTVDNGRAFYGHKDIAKRASVNVYFADPYASWQRGSNENSNGLVRRYFPKGTKFSTISAQQLRRAVEKINLMPRKLLKWKSAYEVHYGVSVALIA